MQLEPDFFDARCVEDVASGIDVSDVTMLAAMD